MLLPTPRVTRRAAGLLREHGCGSVWFGAAAPLGLMAPALRRAGAERIVATTHGHEAGWAQLPASRELLRRIGEGTDTITYLGEYTRSRIAAALTPEAAARMVQLPPGVDEKTFHPGSGRRRGPRAARARRPARGGVRVPPGAAQGSGHADPGDAPDPARGARRGAAGRGRRAVRQGAEEAGCRDRCRRLGALHRAGAVGGAAGALRRGRRLRDAVPYAPGRARRRRARHRLPGGVGHRTAGGGGRFGRGARRRTGRGDGLGGARRARGGRGRGVRGADRRAAPGPQLRRRMGERGREWVEEKWRWDLLAEKLKALL